MSTIVTKGDEKNSPEECYRAKVKLENGESKTYDVLCTEAFRRDAGIYGGASSTPNAERLATQAAQSDFGARNVRNAKVDVQEVRCRK